MSLTIFAVPFSHFIAKFFSRQVKALKNHKGMYWCIVCHRVKHQNISSLCKPQTLFQAFNQKPIWLRDDRTASAKMQLCFWVLTYKNIPAPHCKLMQSCYRCKLCQCFEHSCLELSQLLEVLQQVTEGSGMKGWHQLPHNSGNSAPNTATQNHHIHLLWTNCRDSDT